MIIPMLEHFPGQQRNTNRSSLKISFISADFFISEWWRPGKAIHSALLAHWRRNPPVINDLSPPTKSRGALTFSVSLVCTSPCTNIWVAGDLDHMTVTRLMSSWCHIARLPRLGWHVFTLFKGFWRLISTTLCVKINRTMFVHRNRKIIMVIMLSALIATKVFVFIRDHRAVNVKTLVIRQGRQPK